MAAVLRGDPGLPNLRRTTIEWITMLPGMRARGALGAICPAGLAKYWPSGHAECGEGTPIREGPLAEINNSDELEAWLEKQPREVPVAVAARAALRVLPTLEAARTGGYRGDFFAAIVLPVFRATGVAWAAAKYPARAMRLGDYAAAAAAGAALWSAFSADATRVEEGASASVIAGSPLWPQHQFGSEPLRSLWDEMKQTLHAAAQDWDVWTNWYEDRLYGRPRADKWELAYVRIDDEIWKQGPAIVNAKIKRRIEADTAPDLREQVIADASNVPVNPASSVGATKTRIAGLRRPVFKGFFSYTHRDAEVDPHIVEAFSSELEKHVDAKLVNARFEIWRDNEKLQVGDFWDQRIEGAIDASHIFIVVLTPKWISSDYCRKEFEAFEKIEAARNSGGYVIPIYARDIERQARFLEAEQRELLDRLKRIQYQQVISKQFARLSADERSELIEAVADPICDMLDRLRDKQET